MIFIEERGISYELNKNDFTANIIHSPNAIGNIYIPSSVNYQSHQYFIKSIKEKSFYENNLIESIEFANDSQLVTIEQNAFLRSTIAKITFPSSLKELKEGWCCNVSELTDISISPINRYYSYVGQKLIVGKSDFTKDIFDILIFARRDIEKVTIPSYIKYIASYAFSQCYQLKTVKLNENLISIGAEAFSFTILKSILIPPKVRKIQEGWCRGISELENVSISPENKNFKLIDNQMMVGKEDENSESFDVLYFAPRSIEQVIIPSNIKHINSYAFADCHSVNYIEFEEGSELKSIGKNAFNSSSIQEISLPAKVEYLDEEWCRQTNELKLIKTSSENKKFAFVNESLLVGKSNIINYFYDAIHFASRSLEEVTISSSIKRICSFAFYQCYRLKKVEFQPDSHLISIGKYSFSSLAIEKIAIPKSVTSIEMCAFFGCRSLKSVGFNEESKLKEIQRGTFAFTSIKNISIPSSIAYVGEKAFLSCESLKTIEFLSDDIKLHFSCMYRCSSLLLISFPNSTKIAISKNYYNCNNAFNDLSVFICSCSDFS